MIKNATKLNKKRRRALWAKALESGKYKQAKNNLRNSQGFCCLGVACDLYATATGRGQWNKPNWIFEAGSGESRNAVLPTVVADWFGLMDTNPDLVDPDTGQDHSSAFWNDTGFTFTKIAKMVRAL
jgi:hypothetical protein